MRKIQTLLLLLTFFICTNVTAQSDTGKTGNQKKKTQIDPEADAKMKTMLEENKEKIALFKKSNPEEERDTPKIESKLMQDSNTKFAAATKPKKKVISKPASVPVNIDDRIKSVKGKIVEIQNSSIPNKEAELEKLRTTLVLIKAEKTTNK